MVADITDIGGFIQNGLEGCGSSVSFALARSGLGKRLRYAASLAGDERDDGLSLWKEEVATELMTNTSGLLNRVYPAPARLIRNGATSFPSITALDLYLHPLTSKAKSHAPNRAFLWDSIRMPDASRIASCCELYFQWGSEQGIVNRFYNLLLDGISLRSSIALCASQTPATSGISISCFQRTRVHKGTLHPLIEYRAEINLIPILTLIKSDLKGHRRSSTSPSAKAGTHHREWERIRVWLPAPIVEVTLPDLVDAFRNKQAATRKKKPTAPSYQQQDVDRAIDLSSAAKRQPPAKTTPKKAKRYAKTDAVQVEVIDLTYSDSE